jgi:hypothetical protein
MKTTVGLREAAVVVHDGEGIIAALPAHVTRRKKCRKA